MSCLIFNALNRNLSQDRKRSESPDSEGGASLVHITQQQAENSKKLRSMSQSIEPTRLDVHQNEVILLKVVNPNTSSVVGGGDKTFIQYDSPLTTFGGFSQVKSSVGLRKGFTMKEKVRRKKNTSPNYKSTYDKFFLGDRNALNRKTIGDRFKFKKKKISSAVGETYRMEEKVKYFKLLNNEGCSSSAHFSSRQSPGLSMVGISELSTTKRKTELMMTSTARKASVAPQLPGVTLDSSFSPSGFNDSLEVTKIPTKIPGHRNSLEESLKMKNVYSPNYLKELQLKYDSRHRELNRKIAEEEIKKKFHEEKNKESKEMLEERIIKHMEITNVDVEDIREIAQGDVEDTMSSEEGGEEEETDEDVEYNESSEEDEFYGDDEEDVELPDITPQMEEVILRAKRSRGEVLVDSHKIQITRKDIDTLHGLNWLNDEIINFYLQMIVDRSAQEGLKVYATSTFFYPKMMSHGQPALKRWTRRVDIFQQDLMLMPVHLGMHWCLAVVDFRKPGVYYYDSMGGNNTQCLTSLLKYLQDEYKDKKGGDLDVGGYEAKILKDIPQQMNGSDCGMFACKFAEYISRDAAITFNQEDMPYFRKRMIWEIVKDTLLHP